MSLQAMSPSGVLRGSEWGRGIAAKRKGEEGLADFIRRVLSELPGQQAVEEGKGLLLITEGPNGKRASGEDQTVMAAFMRWLCDKLPWLSLRVYNGTSPYAEPSQPRVDTIVDGVKIPTPQGKKG